MMFHTPSFLHYFAQNVADLNYFHHNGIIHLYSPDPWLPFSDLQDLVWHALEQSLDEPLAAPTGPRERSLIDAPIDTHMDALKDALMTSTAYLKRMRADHLDFDNGEEERLYEYQIDLSVVQRIVIRTREEQDTKLAEQLIKGEPFISDRLLESKIRHTIGVAFSQRRIRAIMHRLIQEKKIKNNGRLHSRGREVLLQD